MREQFLLTPVGQLFLHTLKEELIADFYKTPHFLVSLGAAIIELLDAGQKFSLSKCGLEDDKAEEELDELLCTFPIHALSMRIDETIPLSQAWWMPAFEKAAQVFTTASLQDPRLCFWNDLPFPILPLPEEFLPFTELDPGFHQEDHSSPSTLLLLALTRWLLTSQILSSKKMSCHPLLGMWSRELIRPRTPADSTVPSSEFIAALGDTVFPSSAVK